MKKILFFLLLFFSLILSVDALTLSDIKVGDVYEDGTIIEYMYYSSDIQAYVAYYDKNDVLFESHAIKNALLTGELNSIGDGCYDSYFCDENYLIVDNDDSNFPKVKYWEVVAIDSPNIYEFCGIGDLTTSYSSYVSVTYPDSFCNQLYTYSSAVYGEIFVEGSVDENGVYSSGYYTEGLISPSSYTKDPYYGNFPFIVFKEVEVKEAEYELSCDAKGLKEGSIVNCTLNVDSPSKIKDVVVSFDNEKYSIVNASGNNNLKLDKLINDKEEDKIYLSSESGISGKSEILTVELTLKEDVPSKFLIKTKEINYSFTNNLNFISYSEDSIDYVESNNEEEDILEDDLKEENKTEIREENPNTVDYILALLLMLLLCSMTIFTIKKRLNN